MEHRANITHAPGKSRFGVLPAPKRRHHGSHPGARPETTPLPRTVTLRPDAAAALDALLADGAYADEAEVLGAAFAALRQRHASAEPWLLEAVLPVADAMAADPDQAIPAAAVFAELREMLAPAAPVQVG